MDKKSRIEFIKKIQNNIVFDEYRHKILFSTVNGALFVVATVMSIVNVFTEEYMLMCSTAGFAAFCLLNMLLVAHTNVRSIIIRLIFGVEALALLVFFIVSGIPDGFSALWICLIPSFAMFIFGAKEGGAYATISLAVLIFFFWVPAGRELLMYQYSDTFMLRFPFFYCAVFLIASIAEWIRMETNKQLGNSIDKYSYLYRHDALTGVFNRFGIKEYMDNAFKDNAKALTAVIMIDIDDFKMINDTYGHDCGDQILKMVAKVPQDVTCEECNASRWGGEEFLLVMHCEHDAAEVAERIRTEIENARMQYEGREIQITISAGVCIIKKTKDFKVEDAIIQADRALYEAKQNGKNQVRVSVLD